ncbi:MAG TPA: hypothetical protein VKU01_36275 [Bryobacteraceae bacterium]|nr:hypothetical protein [Bryobacteraceae bacterium]
MQDAEFSPDGKWMAYVSNETGANEVYVQAFPGPGHKQRISLSGGANPAWARKGRELFYLSRASDTTATALMAVDVETGDTFRAGIPRALFTFPSNVASIPSRGYDPYPDGQHFIAALHKRPTVPPTTKLNLVVNWIEEVKRRVPLGKP